ncbi:hypothetical protein F511_25478 [Dorcoceras hygrometricum]|uniref:Uncharacterized protein n=1 Tax=Dorcoceras hygrometricum TaxID=472368 RepID=A0A2Z7ATP9_9LAMI|nr:hypothetical protein F511_25478 [Dorcoceras hygrometricum]
MVKRLETLSHDPLGITDSACKNQSVMVSVQYGLFNTNIPIRSTTIGKSRVARDPITMHTSWRSNSDIACVTSIGYPRTKANSESSTTEHRLLHASGPHPTPPPDDTESVNGSKGDVSVTQCELLVLELNLKLLLVDIARSVRLNEEVTRVSQYFGVLTIDSADGYWNQQI